MLHDERPPSHFEQNDNITCWFSCWSAPEILEFILYAYSCQYLSMNGELHVCSGARLIILGLSIRLNHCYFVRGRSEGSEEPAHLRRLVLAFAARLCNMIQHPVNLLLKHLF